MRERLGDKCNYVELPFGELVDNLIDFSEIRNCFEVVNRTYTDFLDDYHKIEEEMQQAKLPLVITEGKTDWKHLKHALQEFHSKGVFENLNIQFLEYETDMGAEKLESLLTKLAMVPQLAPIIGVFDNDCKTGKRYIEPKEFGNNVYACSLTDTQGYCDEICIELLYPREDLTRLWPDNRRVYLSDEFSEKSHHLKTDSSIVSQNKTIFDAINRNIIKVVDSAVFNDEEKELAVSKEEFATRVYDCTEPYQNMNIDGFRKIFETIEVIIS